MQRAPIDTVSVPGRTYRVSDQVPNLVASRPMVPKPNSIPVIDIFAGPGGLAEGFGAFRSSRGDGYHIALSIEKDAVACNTLRLRKFVRSFRTPPDGYRALLAGEMTLERLLSMHPDEAAAADRQTWQATLGAVPDDQVNRRIRAALGEMNSPWALVGGPPCQAYSLVGRSRMRNTHPDFERDERHFLYREYLKIVARHKPTVFVMENVKGILSSTNDGAGMFRRILTDLRRPGVALGNTSMRGLEYRLYGLAEDTSAPIEPDSDRVGEFLVRAENYGVPQTRHRVFVVGVRADIDGHPEPLVRSDRLRTVSDVLKDLPPIRSRISRGADSWADWLATIEGIQSEAWMKADPTTALGRAAVHANAVLGGVRRKLSAGGAPMEYRSRPALSPELENWYKRGSREVTLHEARGHMRDDLRRYFFAACYGAANDRSATLRDFPKELRPRHSNIRQAIEGDMFGDRFRVQRASRPSSTVTSHLAKDGHYFIHYAADQCRSITVREAARLQTFPDSYFFTGNRTEQYHQVGNAVPPMLAKRVASSVYPILAAARKER